MKDTAHDDSAVATATCTAKITPATLNPRDILGSAGVYSLAMLASKAASFILLPVYTRYLSPADYGALELVDLTIMFFTGLVGVRFGEAIFYFATNTDDAEGRRKVYGTALFGAVLSILPLWLLGVWLAPLLTQWVFADQSGQYTDLLRLGFHVMAGSMPIDVALAYMRFENRPASYVTISVARLLLTIVINVILLIGFGKGATAMLLGSAISALTISVAVITYILRTNGLHFSWDLYRRMIPFGFALSVSGLAMLIVHYGDRVFLSRYVSVADIGVYSLAYRMGMLVLYIQAPFCLYWHAQMYEVVKRPGGDRTFARFTTYMLLILVSGAVVLAVWSGTVLKVLAGPAFQAAAPLVPWIVLLYTISGIGVDLRQMIVIEGKPSHETVILWGGTCLTVLGYAVLIPSWGIYGAVGATAAGFSWNTIAGYVYSQRLRYVPFENGRLSRLVAIAIITVSMHSLLPRTSPLAALLLNSGFVVLFFVLLNLSGFFSGGERQYAFSVLRSIRRSFNLGMSAP